MTEKEFTSWATNLGVSKDLINQLVKFAQPPDNVLDEPEPVSSLQGIREFTENIPGVTPLEHGFLFIGSCLNGDPVALDVADNIGSIWYVCHETMYGTPLREAAIRVADDVAGLLDGLSNEEGFPWDYYDA